MNDRGDDSTVREDPLGWTTRQQARASDPTASAWVAANAGSGKTHVLSQRVIRLLLDGARPSSILCLTYTKAAASEMSNRVFQRLAEWTRLSDDALSTALTAMEGGVPDKARLAFARQLFALALETPGGLKIQTIHAFCEAVLHRFPLEANVAGHFAVMDDGETASLLAEAKRSLLSATSTEDDADLAAAFADVLEAAGEYGLEALLQDLIERRQDVARFLDDAARAEGVASALSGAAGVGVDETAEGVRADVWPFDAMPVQAVAAYRAAADAQTNKRPRDFANDLAAIAAAGDPQERWRLLTDLLCQKSGQPRSLPQFSPKGILDVMPDAGERLDAMQAAFLAARNRMRIIEMRRLTCAALKLGSRLLRDYDRLKRLQGRLDFDDLVERTAQLLGRDGAGAWVHYKLDRGIDHILIDEAQDTSPAQWTIVRRLADEFFAGKGAVERLRTLFAVGDEKQSIYSFQGAEPERFRAEGRSVDHHASQAAQRFENVRLLLSFRSTGDVLKAVDRVFAEPDARRGVGTEDRPLIHETVRGREPGLVDVWQMIAKEKSPDNEDWTAPFDDTPESDPKAVLARRVAATIREWTANGYRIEKGRRVALRAGDILILVRKRDGFVNALARSLKQAPAVPVAGADRLRLTDHIAVMDLMALSRVLALPEDDLSLASLLKSPLFGLGEDDIYALCHQRKAGMSVMAQLRLLATAGQPGFADALVRLERYSALARHSSVADFYIHILGPEGGRASFLARLGSEAADVLDAFVDFALEHETGGLPGLRSFLAVLEDQAPEIKREMDQDRDEVRIMTVHAAKGLEAPIVFLVDSGGAAAVAQHIPRLRRMPRGERSPAVLWVPGKDYENSVSERLRDTLVEAAKEEYRRLLYVGMTRAADRLVVCGYHGVNAPSGPHWLGMVRDALQDEGHPMTFGTGEMSWEGVRFQTGGDQSAHFPDAPLAAQPETDAATENDLAQPLPPPARPPRPLVPSGVGSLIAPQAPPPFDRSPLWGNGQGRPSIALERGRIIHRFLQILPGLDRAGREAAARRYLARAVPDWPEEESKAVLASVMAILEEPDFEPVFGPGSEPEVAIMGTVRIGVRDHIVSGRIDRMVVDDRRVTIVDYKTDRLPPSRVEDVSEAYRAQMALYRALLAPLYPDRTINAALIFTETPALIKLSAAALDAALEAIAP